MGSHHDTSGAGDAGEVDAVAGPIGVREKRAQVGAAGREHLEAVPTQGRREAMAMVRPWRERHAQDHSAAFKRMAGRVRYALLCVRTAQRRGDAVSPLEPFFKTQIQSRK